ncbi:MAG: LysR family transcriptional regulator [Bdellovibrionaceae bacterium]|nr:LysR family transcriptional regulator [Pseudobdellovibrionaceae bacterium]
MDLNEILVFERVSALKSFTAAALSLGLKKSTISAKIANLERRLGIRLINRTTRKISLTEAGIAYHRHCQETLRNLYQAEEKIIDKTLTPRGTLKVSMPLDFGLYCIKNFLKIFTSNYPDISLEIFLTHQEVDPNDQGIDLVIRPAVERFTDSSYIVKKIFETNLSMYVSVEYLKKCRKNRVPLAAYDFIRFSPDFKQSLIGPQSVGQLYKVDDEQLKKVLTNTRLVLNDMLACKEACLAGLGVAVLPTWLIRKELFDRKLVLLDAKRLAPKASFYALYSNRKWIPKKTEIFLNEIKKHFQDFSD